MKTLNPFDTDLANDTRLGRGLDPFGHQDHICLFGHCLETLDQPRVTGLDIGEVDDASVKLDEIDGVIQSLCRWKTLEAMRIYTRMAPAQVARLGVARSFQISATFGDMSLVDNVCVALQRQNGLALCHARLRRHYA